MTNTEKAVKGILAEIDSYKRDRLAHDLRVCVSKGNKKIGRTLNVSLPPVITCANCSGCKELCYDIKAVLQYENVRKARARNYVIFKENPENYFNQIRSVIKSRRTNKFFRWHVAGDIPNYNYLVEMIKIAKENPDFKFWTYTKNYGLVNLYCMENGGKGSIPENLSIMFSEWRGMPMTNPFGFPEFRVVFKDEQKPEGVKWCNGNCDHCIRSNSHCVKGETVYCMEH